MKKLRKLVRRFLITYWPWPPYLWRHYNKKAKKFKGIARILASRPRGRTSKGWVLYRKRYSKVFKAAQLREDIVDWLTQYPFNKYGWNDFKYWFKYRLQKKHKYHILDTGLKPGYYEYYDVVTAAVAGPRFKYLFEKVWQEFQESKDELGYDEKPIIQKSYHKIMNQLKEAYDWFTTDKPALEKQIENYWNETAEEYPKKKTKTEVLSFFERKPSKKEIQRMKKIRVLEKTIMDNDTKYLKIIIENRISLTT